MDEIQHLAQTYYKLDRLEKYQRNDEQRGRRKKLLRIKNSLANFLNNYDDVDDAKIIT